MLPTVYLAAVALPLLLIVLAVGLRIAAAVAARIDGADARPLAPVTELPAAHELASLPQVVAPPAAAPAPTSRASDGAAPVPRPGPLQLVDETAPSTKRCPDCAETVLGSARVCKHCHYRFEPARSGSWAV